MLCCHDDVLSLACNVSFSGCLTHSLVGVEKQISYFPPKHRNVVIKLSFTPTNDLEHKIPQYDEYNNSGSISFVLHQSTILI